MPSCEVLTRGLASRRERLALLGCVLLGLAYAGALAWFQLTADRIDSRFFQKRDAFNIAALGDHRVRIGDAVPLSQAGHPGAQVALLAGWSVPEPWGIWTTAPVATLAVALPPDHPARLVLAVQAFVNLGQSGEQTVILSADGRDLGTWTLRDRQAALQVELPAPAGPDGVVVLGFKAAHPERMPHSKDPRRLGLGLQSFTVRAAD